MQCCNPGRPAQYALLFSERAMESFGERDIALVADRPSAKEGEAPMAGAVDPFARALRSATKCISTRKGDRSMATTAKPSYVRRRDIDNSVWYADHHLLSFLAKREDTGGAFALLETHSLKGGEPPLHVHHHEDESLYILEGEVDFFLDGRRVPCKPGDLVFVPRGTQHTYEVQTDEFRVLILSVPAGLEQYFVEMGRPAETLTPPTTSQGPLDADRMAAVARKHGSEFTSDDA
jgi:quercetin dioxygenase-like cupin family protein